MSVPALFFLALVVVLLGLLVWASRPAQRRPLSAVQAFEALSQQRHYARLPQILQSLREDDTEFLRDRGHTKLLVRVRQERKRIALQYLRDLEEEFRMLLECSRILATLAPELPARSEFERFRQSVSFAWNCRYLRWRLQVGLQPWDTFGTLSDMSGTITLQLEAAARRLAEKAFSGGTGGLVPQDRGGYPS